MNLGRALALMPVLQEDHIDRQGEPVTDDPHIPLAAAIRALRAELVDAVRAGSDEEIRFALGPVELELALEATREGEGEAGIKFSLLAFGARVTRSSASTQLVRMTLTPVRADAAAGEDKDVLVASELEFRD